MFETWYVKARGTICQYKRCMKGVTFLSKMVYKRIRGWTSGQSLPYDSLMSTPHPEFHQCLPIQGFEHISGPRTTVIIIAVPRVVTRMTAP